MFLGVVALFAVTVLAVVAFDGLPGIMVSSFLGVRQLRTDEYSRSEDEHRGEGGC